MLPRQAESQLSLAFVFLILSLLTSFVSPEPSATANNNNLQRERRQSYPLGIDWSPAPDAADGPAFSARALRDKKYLPAQIGGIVAAYGVSLVLVAIALLSLAKKRREHLQGGSDEAEYEISEDFYDSEPPRAGFDRNLGPYSGRAASVRNFSYPSPLKTQFGPHSPAADQTSNFHPSPTSTVSAPGIDPAVNQEVVAADRDMAQSQLEEMYKHVMDYEDAKERGVALEASIDKARAAAPTSPRRDRPKPAGLNLGPPNQDNVHSKTSAFFAALRSPRKKQAKGLSISSPILTPQSATFSRHELQNMNATAPRAYAPAPAPAPAPPNPSGPVSFGAHVRQTRDAAASGLSPESTQSIDERIAAQSGPTYTVGASRAPSEVDPGSATSEDSQAPLVGLRLTPKPSGALPSLPSSPKPGAAFSRCHGSTSAVRTGGNLPLRAYEPASGPASVASHNTKQTVFERKGPLSPTTGRTPMTANAVPYSPYQPFTPVVPITPSLVTKEDRKRMKRNVPKTPTMEMVPSTEDLW